MGASVVACCDAPPVLEPGEHVLDFVALLIRGFAIGCRQPAFGPRWDAGGDTTLGKSLTKGITVIPLVGNERLGVRQYGIDQSRALVVARLTLGEQEDDRTSVAITDRVQLGIQSTLRAAYTAW